MEERLPWLTTSSTFRTPASSIVTATSTPISARCRNLVVYGVQGALRQYHGAKEGPPVASTLDHIVAAVAG